ncbi:MAG: UDP-N-acetylmuramate--L-alanine ligase [Deltaproteobacteria bacterium]|nr:UDP-N-acetylmuramate--L-alanine ligase [Deltaproteobacteria bacterium]
MSFPPSRTETPEEHTKRLAVVPRDPRSVHLIAVAGTGMGALACMLAASGRAVTGSDQAVYPPMSNQLERAGIRIMEGYRLENLSHRPDLVVVGNAMSRGNPEIEALLESGIPYVSMPEALRLYFFAGKHPVVVAGTHGKTTTTSLAASVLAHAGRDPSLLVGGIARDFDGGFRLGMGEAFVLEGDEYDTAFFDKEPKFLHYAPRTAILTSVEFDHADIYRDLDHVREAFRRFVATIPEAGLLAVCADDPEARAIAQGASCRVLPYGLSEGSALRGKVREIGPVLTRFEAEREGTPLGEFAIPLPGAHNVRNALGVLAACLELGLGVNEIRAGLARFGGVARRQEVRGEAGGVLVIDDFAHHPTAIRETVAAIRARYPARRLWALFEPRSNTSRRNVHQKEYVDALEGADVTIIAGVENPGKIPDAERLSPDRIAADLRDRGRDAHYIGQVEEIVAYASENARKGDVLLVMSNGGFGGIHQKLLAALGYW